MPLGLLCSLWAALAVTTEVAPLGYEHENLVDGIGLLKPFHDVDSCAAVGGRNVAVDELMQDSGPADDAETTAYLEIFAGINGCFAGGGIRECERAPSHSVVAELA